jgi:D-serine deaminase-like pyridoxal phosphate-dependent protein
MLPRSKSDIPTPALLLDLERFESNLRKMQTHVDGAGKRLRPHAKAHKCVEIARRQIELGATGVCVATLPELELMTGAGFSALLTTPVADPAKTDRVARIAGTGAKVAVVVDHPEQARLYEASAERTDTPLEVWLDLDVGDHRTGIPCDERALDLARRVVASRQLRLGGLQAYSVSGSHREGRQARSDHSRRAIAEAVALQKDLLDEGLDARGLTGGSTGTWDIDTTIPELTELQAGSYPMMDLAYRKLLGDDFAPALTVLATVVSANHEERVTVDAGFKALATDRPFGPEPLDLEGTEWQWAGDEHGFILFGDRPRTLGLGDRLELIPPHCDPTMNLHDRVFVTRGDDVEDVWPLKRSRL